MAWAALAVGAATAIYGGVKAHKAGKKAKAAEKKALANANKIPEAQKERLARLKGEENTEMPGQEEIRQDLNASQSQNINALKEVGNQADFQNQLALSMSNQQDKLIGLGIKSAEYKLDRKADVNDALADMAGLQSGNIDREREINDSVIARHRADQGAGQQTMISGMTSAASTGVGAMGKGGSGGGGSASRSNNRRYSTKSGIRSSNRALKRYERDNS